MWWYSHCSSRCISFSRYTMSQSKAPSPFLFGCGPHQEGLGIFQFLNFIYILYQKFFRQSNFLRERRGVSPLPKKGRWAGALTPLKTELQVEHAFSTLTRLCGFLLPTILWQWLPPNLTCLVSTVYWEPIQALVIPSVFETLFRPWKGRVLVH